MFFEGILQAQVVAGQLPLRALRNEPQERRDAARGVGEVQHFGGGEGPAEDVSGHRGSIVHRGRSGATLLRGGWSQARPGW